MPTFSQGVLSPEPLELARGIRFPRDDEYPAGQESERTQATQVRLVTGFVHKEACGESFGAFFEANVHASNVWQCFSELVTGLLPEVAAPLLQFKDDEPVYGNYAKREEVLAVFRPHAMFLQHEAYLGFGMMFQYQGRIEEVFVHSAKYFQVWTNQPDKARELFTRHGLTEVPYLQFIDEYPRVTEALEDAEGKIAYPQVMNAIEAAFRGLAPVHPPE